MYVEMIRKSINSEDKKPNNLRIKTIKERRKSKMKKNLGVVQAVYPMPVLMVAAYDENDSFYCIVGKRISCALSRSLALAGSFLY
jgi:hypothetical protein